MQECILTVYQPVSAQAHVGINSAEMNQSPAVDQEDSKAPGGRPKAQALGCQEGPTVKFAVVLPCMNPGGHVQPFTMCLEMLSKYHSEYVLFKQKVCQPHTH